MSCNAMLHVMDYGPTMWLTHVSIGQTFKKCWEHIREIFEKIPQSADIHITHIVEKLGPDTKYKVQSKGEALGQSISLN